MTLVAKSRSVLAVQHSWGDIHMMVRNQPCSVDLTTIRRGERSSQHSHRVRSELFHTLDDQMVLELDGDIQHPGAHDDIVIAPGHQHRLWTEAEDSRLLVICCGKWTAEDQGRHGDDYGREGTSLTI